MNRMNLHDILKNPIVTERSTLLKERLNQYVFKVGLDASKIQIKDAIQKIFKVEVEKVRTARFSGKLRRLALGRPQGRRPEWKKAIVSVKKGQEIKIGEEAR